MKAITLLQPWATLVAIGAKRLETRSWSTNYRGPLAIHAGLSTRFIDPNGPEYICAVEPFYTTLMNAIKVSDQEFMPLGCIIATCTLMAVVQVPLRGQLFTTTVEAKGLDFPLVFPPPEPELSFGDFTPGRFAWILADVNPLPKPVPARGALGLWDWTPRE